MGTHKVFSNWEGEAPAEPWDRWSCKPNQPQSARPHAAEIVANPTELASVVFGLSHYAKSKESGRSAKARIHRDKLGGVCVTLPRAGYRSRFPKFSGEPDASAFRLMSQHLNPGRYVGVAEGEAEDFDFTERLEELNEELETLNGEAHELEERIAANVAAILEGTVS